MTDEVILKTARQCFLSGGPGVSTAHIATVVGRSQATLFKRFGSKQELMLRALMPPAEPAWLKLVRPGPDDRPIDQQLVEIGLAASRFYQESIPAMMMLKASGIDEETILNRYDVPPPVLTVRTVSAWFQAAKDQGRIRDLDPMALSMSFFLAVHGRSFLQHLAGAWMPMGIMEDGIRAHCDVLWRGLAPQEVSV